MISAAKIRIKIGITQERKHEILKKSKKNCRPLSCLSGGGSEGLFYEYAGMHENPAGFISKCAGFNRNSTGFILKSTGFISRNSGFVFGSLYQMDFAP